MQDWKPIKNIYPDDFSDPITMHNMSMVIDQVEPHIIERLDLDLS